MKQPHEVLEEMMKTCKERSAVYGANYKMVGNIMTVLFPDGVTLKTPEDFTLFSLFDTKINKLCRFAHSELTHVDSIHDDGVYSAIIESLIDNNDNKGIVVNKKKHFLGIEEL